MSQGPSPERIAELKNEGYRVHMVNDQDGLYAWYHPTSGASQSHHKDVQPPRTSELQAWDDCDAYVSLDMPTKLVPDWGK
ncbi:hypothetical protein ACUXAV_005920 [Cupriavidus metallidurans]|jgi:hypothetical protein|uniref:hypothetical protein n=1 Tax=Cupriavidus TaxID=106589 RepID=UPI0004932676|nr:MULTISPECIES: hypothetical protein [Cupriavidus]KAB0597110.1 hypothetical protein F7R19_26995 [Cupriavidus pauculus]MCA3187392.1 hypothetical protein [Cupriavidus sp.]MCA3194018.1 hypothetical protein [Cupriavidus sp.]MCA3198447.1 hypothetical protein [Cupriavidus sp.]MCA3232206.1 hypothetical protein [Cupriavidus sp.]